MTRVIIKSIYCRLFSLNLSLSVVCHLPTSFSFTPLSFIFHCTKFNKLWVVFSRLRFVKYRPSTTIDTSVHCGLCATITTLFHCKPCSTIPYPIYFNQYTPLWAMLNYTHFSPLYLVQSTVGSVPPYHFSPLYLVQSTVVVFHHTHFSPLYIVQSTVGRVPPYPLQSTLLRSAHCDRALST